MIDTKTTLKIDDASFDTVIKDGVVLVDFWAEWCGPCRIQGPIIERIAEKLGDKARICKMNVDDNPRTAERFEITNIPTIILFKNGGIIERFIGLQNDATLINAVGKVL